VIQINKQFQTVNAGTLNVRQPSSSFFQLRFCPISSSNSFMPLPLMGVTDA